MTITNPDQIPATPIYTITVSATGAASLNGEEVTEAGLSPSEARVAALAEVRIKAAYHGRPVRVIAKEADGAAWPLIVDVDGSVTTLDRPHPMPPPSPARAAVQAPSEPPSAPPSGPVAMGATPPPPAPNGPMGPDAWAAPLPPAFGLLWGQLVAQEKAGTLTEGIITAAHLENALAQQYGPLHPHTVNVGTVRAWLTLRNTTAWPETVELLIQTARRRQGANAQPQKDTDLMIRNAHAAWRKLTKEDPEYAREIADQVMDLVISDNQRARDVIRWIEGGAAA